MAGRAERRERGREADLRDEDVIGLERRHWEYADPGGGEGRGDPKQHADFGERERPDELEHPPAILARHAGGIVCVRRGVRRQPGRRTDDGEFVGRARDAAKRLGAHRPRGQGRAGGEAADAQRLGKHLNAQRCVHRARVLGTAFVVSNA